MERVLVVEDEDAIRNVIKDYLVREGFNVIEAKNGKEAWDLVEEEKFSIAILDVMLPFIDGWTICRRIKEQNPIPVIFLTARAEEYDEVMGFELGADDYIKKPFSPAILLMRMKRLLNNQVGKEVGASKIVKGVLEIDKEGMKVRIEEREILLTHKEFQILVYLVEQEGTVLTREAILKEVWGYDFVGDIRVVDNHIKKIRKAFEEYAYLIRTVFGAGYIFEVEE